MSHGRGISLLILSQHSSTATKRGFRRSYCQKSLAHELWAFLVSTAVPSYFLRFQWVNTCFPLEESPRRQLISPQELLSGNLVGTPSAPVWNESVFFLCRWACLRSTQRSQNPCRWRLKPSSCAALSLTQIAGPPPLTCSPTSFSQSPAARRRTRAASQVGSVQFSSAARVSPSSFVLSSITFRVS